MLFSLGLAHCVFFSVRVLLPAATLGLQVLGCVYEPDGSVGASTYPLAKKAHSLEFLRSIAHLRPRTKVLFTYSSSVVYGFLVPGTLAFYLLHLDSFAFFFSCGLLRLSVCDHITCFSLGYEESGLGVVMQLGRNNGLL